MFCSHCGKPNKEGGKFCAHCGKQLFPKGVGVTNHEKNATVENSITLPESRRPTLTWRTRLIGWSVILVLSVIAFAIRGPERGGALIGGMIGGAIAIYLIYRFIVTPLMRKSRLSERVRNIVALLIAVTIFFAVTFGVNNASKHNDAAAPVVGRSKQDAIKEIVQQTKEQTTFPKQINTITTWTDVLEEPGAIRYVYTLHDMDENQEDQLSDEALKSMLALQSCKIADIKNNILDQDISIEGLYQVQNSTQTFFFSVSKADCS